MRPAAVVGSLQGLKSNKFLVGKLQCWPLVHVVRSLVVTPLHVGLRPQLHKLSFFLWVWVSETSALSRVSGSMNLGVTQRVLFTLDRGSGMTEVSIW